MKTPIFIFSCDKNKDILAHTLESVKIYWPEAIGNIYIGVNTIENDGRISYKELYAEKSCWKQETLTQLEHLNKSKPGEDVIVYLDDFLLLKRVNNDIINEYVNKFRNLKINYLRLTPYESSIFHKIKKNKFTDIHEIPKEHIYPHSLQVAIWNREYLKKIITEAENIWDFENIKINNNSLYSTSKKLIEYRHIVEKGRWNYWAKKLCIKHINYFLPGEREIRTGLDKVIIDSLRKISFFVFGYSFLRIRKVIM